MSHVLACTYQGPITHIRVRPVPGNNEFCLHCVTLTESLTLNMLLFTHRWRNPTDFGERKSVFTR